MHALTLHNYIRRNSVVQFTHFSGYIGTKGPIKGSRSLLVLVDPAICPSYTFLGISSCVLHQPLAFTMHVIKFIHVQGSSSPPNSTEL